MTSGKTSVRPLRRNSFQIAPRMASRDPGLFRLGGERFRSETGKPWWVFGDVCVIFLESPSARNTWGCNFIWE